MLTLDAAIAERDRMQVLYDEAADRVREAVKEALQQGITVEELDGRPYTATYIRRLARQAGIPVQKRRPGPRPGSGHRPRP